MSAENLDGFSYFFCFIPENTSELTIKLFLLNRHRQVQLNPFYMHL